jgi:peptide subunit release factor 1 (eRF1)
MTAATVEQLSGDGVIAVVFDRAHARFFEVTAAGIKELTSLQSPATRGGKFHSDRQDSPGAGEHRYHGRLREEERRHRHAIAAELERLRRGRPQADLVLAGDGEAAEALRRALPAPLAERVIGTERLNPLEVTDAEVRATVERLAQDARRARDGALVAAMGEGLGTGRAENGARAVLRALAKGQVRTLLIRPDVHATGFRCAQTGRLVLSSLDCHGEGDPLPVPDLPGEVAREARRQGAAVVVVHDSVAAEAIDGMAALLRFG